MAFYPSLTPNRTRRYSFFSFFFPVAFLPTPQGFFPPPPFPTGATFFFPPLCSMFPPSFPPGSLPVRELRAGLSSFFFFLSLWGRELAPYCLPPGGEGKTFRHLPLSLRASPLFWWTFFSYGVIEDPLPRQKKLPPSRKSHPPPFPERGPPPSFLVFLLPLR